MTDPAFEAALALAARVLDYVGWTDGTFSTLMDSDVALKDQALAVFAAHGAEAPMRVRSRKKLLAGRAALNPTGEEG